jgi:integrase
MSMARKRTKRRSPHTGAIYRRTSDDMWVGAVTVGYELVIDDDGRPHRRRVRRAVARTDHSELLDALAELQDEVREMGGSLDRTATVAQLAALWLRETGQREVAPSTLAHYRSYIGAWIVPTIGTKRVATLQASDVRALRDVMVDAGRSPITVGQVLDCLSAMLDMGRRERMTRQNVAELVPRPRRRAAARITMTTEQAIAVLHAAVAQGPYSAARAAVALLTSARQAEALGMTWPLVRLDPEEAGGEVVIPPLVDIRWQAKRLPGHHGCGPQTDSGWPCGYKRLDKCPSLVVDVPDGMDVLEVTPGSLWRLVPLKTSSSVRTVPLIDPVVAALKAWRAADPDPHPEGLIFHRGRLPVDAKDDDHWWRDLLLAAGIVTPAQVAARQAPTIHAARHVTHSLLMRAGVDERIIAAITGHTERSGTNKIYEHTQLADLMHGMALAGQLWERSARTLEAS